MIRNRRLLGAALFCLGPLGRAAAQPGPSVPAANAPPPVGASRPVPQAQRFAPAPSFTGAFELFMNRDWLTSEEIVDFGVEPLPRDASTAVAGGRLVLYLNGFPRRGQLALTAVTSGQVLDWHREDRRRCSIHRPHLLTLGQICHYWLSEKEFVSVRWEARAQGPEPGAPIAIRLVARSYKLLE